LIRKEYSSFSEEGINKRITNYIDFLGHKLTKEELRKNSKIFEDFMKTLGRDPLSFNLETLTPNGIFCCIENNADETITVTGKASEWLDFLKQIQQYSPDSVVSN